MKLKQILITCLILLPYKLIVAQDYLPNGTFGTSSFITELQNNYSDENTPFDTTRVNLNATLSLNFYIIKNASGNTDFSSGNLTGYVEELNTYFKPIGIQYQIASVQKVDEYSYAEVNKHDLPSELLTKYQTKDQINIYLVDSLTVDSIPYYGFTYFPNEPDSLFVFMSKAYIGKNNLATQLGHFLGLLSTGDQVTPMETINGSNCHIAGDLICDTDADPGMYGLVDENCLYRGNVIGPNGKFFVPSVANIMSDAPEQCRCIFSMQQYRRMYYYYLKYRQNLR